MQRSSERCYTIIMYYRILATAAAPVNSLYYCETKVVECG